MVLSAYSAGLGRSGVDLVNPGGWPQLREFLAASLSPDLSPTFLLVIGRAAGVTLAYAIVGTTLSLVLGLGLGLLSAEVWWRSVFPRGTGRLRSLGWLTMRGALAVPRAIHELIWGLLLLQILGLDPLVAVLAIAIPFGAIVAKVFAEILDETPHEPLQALLQAGVSPLQALLYGLLPQALPNLLSYSFYRFECSLRSAAVLGVIGAGGLGYEIFLSLQSLDYQQLWTGFYALIGLNGAVDAWSAWVRRRMGFTSRLDLTRPQPNPPEPATDLAPAPAPSSDRWLRLSWWGAGLAIPLALVGLSIHWSLLWSPRTRLLLTELAVAARPGWPDGGELLTLAGLSYLTLSMSVLAAVWAALGGALISFPAAQTVVLPGGMLHPLGQRSSRFPWLAWTVLISSRILLLVSRAIPAPIWALVILFVVFPGVLPGALALAVHNFGILGRLMAESNENLDDRPVRALRTLGAPAATVILYGLLPQNLARFLAYGLYRWEVCLRETVVVGLVGAGGLGRRLTEQISSFDYSSLTLTLGVFVLLTFGVDLLSSQMRHHLR